jgi:hypothetical protein
MWLDEPDHGLPRHDHLQEKVPCTSSCGGIKPLSSPHFKPMARFFWTRFDIGAYAS